LVDCLYQGQTGLENLGKIDYTIRMIELNVIPLWGFHYTILLYYLCESEGEGGDREHDFASRNDDVARHLPQHVKAVGLRDDDVHVVLFGEKTEEKTFNKSVLEQDTSCTL
jgi:hypothetical protein